MNKNNKSINIALISLISCTAAASRLIPIPQVKPFLAIIILSSIILGKVNGIIISTISIIISNTFLGHGPWTIWQIIACSLICIVSKIFINSEKIENQKMRLSLFSFLSTLIIYGGILNLLSILFYSPSKDIHLIITYFSFSFAFDLVNAISTSIFSILLIKPFTTIMDKLKMQ